MTKGEALRVRMRRAVFAWLLAAALALALVPALAHATGYEQSYCGIVKGSGHWCGASGLHSWDWNHAYDGTTTTWVCERIWYPTTESAIEEQCNWYIAYSAAEVDRSCVCYEAHVAQFSGANHIVYGFARA